MSIYIYMSIYVHVVLFRILFGTPHLNPPRSTACPAHPSPGAPAFSLGLEPFVRGSAVRSAGRSLPSRPRDSSMFLPEDIDEAGEIRPQGVWDDMVRAGGGGAALLPAGRGVTWGRCCSKKRDFCGASVGLEFEYVRVALSFQAFIGAGDGGSCFACFNDQRFPSGGCAEARLKSLGKTPGRSDDVNSLIPLVAKLVACEQSYFS